MTKTLKKHLKRRQAIEPIIGHMKQDGKLDVCRLKGIRGNEINAILSGAGWNLRILLSHIRKIIKSGDLSALQRLQRAMILLWQDLIRKIEYIFQVLVSKILQWLEEKLEISLASSEPLRKKTSDLVDEFLIHIFQENIH